MQSRKPVLTALVLLVTAALTGLNVAFPRILPALERSPTALSSNEWWRLVTPVFINRGGAGEIALNFATFILVAVPAERIWGSPRWAAFFLAGALAGEASGLAWKPVGAGSSVAMLGLAGALASWVLARKKSVPARAGAAALLLGGTALAALGNLHGPPLLAGAGLAAYMLWRDGAPASPIQAT